MDCGDIIQLRKWCFQFINLCRSFTRTLVITSYGTDRRRWTRGMKSRWDLTGAGEGDLSNSSSWWDDSSSDGRCGGVGLGGAFFLEEDFFAGFLGDLISFLCLDHDLYQPSGEYDEIEAKGWFQYITRQSEMANTSPATCQCLATFTPLKSKIFFRDVISLLARVVILLIDTATQEVPMTNIWKKLSVQFLRYAIEWLHVKRRTCHKWR